MLEASLGYRVCPCGFGFFLLDLMHAGKCSLYAEMLKNKQTRLEVAQRSRGLVALPEDPDLVPIIHGR